jgi:transcriptional regulator with XRE-family HTH domain
MSLTSIDLNLKNILRDPRRRDEFFRAITEDEIASQIRSLREKRDLTQSELASRVGMKQSAVSRIEQAEYSSWNLKTLFRVVAGLSGRLRVIIEPVEEAIRELEQLEQLEATSTESSAASQAAEAQTASRRLSTLRVQSLLERPQQNVQGNEVQTLLGRTRQDVQRNELNRRSRGRTIAGNNEAALI